MNSGTHNWARVQLFFETHNLKDDPDRIWVMKFPSLVTAHGVLALPLLLGSCTERPSDMASFGASADEIQQDVLRIVRDLEHDYEFVPECSTLRVAWMAELSSLGVHARPFIERASESSTVREMLVNVLRTLDHQESDDAIHGRQDCMVCWENLDPEE